MTEPGLLHILVRGGRRFAIERLDRRGKLMLANAQRWDDEPELAIPEEYAQMADFIRRIIQEFDAHRIAEPHRFGDASWVGMRLAQLLPVEPALRQRWLELRDPVARLDSIHAVLSELARDDDA
jgi:Lon protease-like protein